MSETATASEHEKAQWREALAYKEVLAYKPEQLCPILNLSRAAVYAAIARGDIPSRRVGKRILVPRAALLRMLDGGE